MVVGAPCTCDVAEAVHGCDPRSACPVHGSLGRAAWEGMSAALSGERRAPDFELVIVGHPATAGSKTAGVVLEGPKGARRPKRGPDGRLMTYTRDASKATKPWQATVAGDAGEALGDDHELWRGPVAIEFAYYRPRAGSHLSRRDGSLLPSAPRYPATRPDLTKLLRAVEDALTGVLWAEDSRVVRQLNSKDWGEPERVEVRAWRLPERAGDDGAGTAELALALD